MDFRGVLLFVSVLGAGTLAAVACSAPDPGQITFSERPHQGVDPGSSSGGSSGVASSGGETDAGGGDGGGAVDPVFGPDPFVPGQPGSQDSTQGAGHTGPGSPGATGVDCFTCHGVAGNDAEGVKWTAAGTIYQTDGTTPAPEGVEVVLSDGNGKVLAIAYTDKSGNFAIDPGTLATIPPGTRVGVRDATHTKGVMVAATTGACNSGGTCHGGTQGKVKLQ